MFLQILSKSFGRCRADPTESGLVGAPGDEFACEVQIRAHAGTGSASAWIAASAESGARELVFRPELPLDGVAPGQTAVVYVGTRVLGQCTIDRTVSAVPVGA